MTIDRVIPGLSQTLSATSAGAAKPAQGADFADFLKEAFSNVVETDYADKVSGLEELAGGGGDIHNAIIDTQKAEITLNLALQIRTKMIEAYQEIMRMQI